MTNVNLTKLLLKLHDAESGGWKWVHFCYIPEDIHNIYKEKRAEDLTNMNSTLSRWAKEDFDKDLKVETPAELEELKNSVKEYCKKAYPEIYLEQMTDRQGWLRVWISKKMKEDLNTDGE